MTATISFFPVGNGDMTLVKLDNGQTILIDCNIRKAADDTSDDETLDVAQELRDRLARDDDGRFYVNAMILSHPDQDHCSGLQNHFHLGSPSAWIEDDDKIVINEMWSSPIVFRRSSKHHTLVPDAAAWCAEARRRVKLFRDRGVGIAGDRIKILGEDEDGKTNALSEILVKVNELISSADQAETGSFEARLLGPLPIAGEEAEEETLAKNRSSTILRFALAGDGVADSGRFLTGGDAEVAIWSRLWRVHKTNNVDWLTYHILLSPHHCSWHSLSHDSWSKMGENAIVDDDARSALSQKLKGAVIVSSSKKIKDDDSDPPCIRAKREYLSVVEGADKFHCTGDHEQEVLEFNIGSLGPEKKSRSLKNVSKALGVGITSRTPRDHGIDN